MSGPDRAVPEAEAKLSGRQDGEEKSVNDGVNGTGPTVLLSRSTANQNARNALQSLVEHEMLAEFWTTFTWNGNSRWNRLLPDSWRNQLARRSISEAPRRQVRSVPWREAVRLGARGTPLEALLCSRERWFSVVGMGTNLDKRVASRLRKLRPDMAYAYDGAALETFREARKLGITPVYELTTSYWHWEHELFAEEADLNPEFAGLLGGLSDSAQHLRRKDRELELAEYVIVPSLHVRETLRGAVAEEKIRVVGYGAPPVRGERQAARSAGGPLKVLFVGSLIQRKGISYVLEAVEKLGRHVELTMVGSRFRENAKVDAACRRWRWFATMPHARVMELMQESDVLVLPSLAEGRALVTLEALSRGLPVIVTPNTGAGEVIQDGREGYVVPIRRADLIADRLETLRRDRDLLAEMSRQAQRTASANSWEHYRGQWGQTVRSLACN